jgi:hypothetical protein
MTPILDSALASITPLLTFVGFVFCFVDLLMDASVTGGSSFVSWLVSESKIDLVV